MRRVFLSLLFACCAAIALLSASPQGPSPTPAAAESKAAPPQAVTREALERRLAELRAQYDRLIADANATQGAIQDCQYWLDKLPKAAASATPPLSTSAPEAHR
jgi:hypothetical protein